MAAREATTRAAAATLAPIVTADDATAVGAAVGATLFAPVQMTGTPASVFRHAGHCAGSVHAGLEPKLK